MVGFTFVLWLGFEWPRYYLKKVSKVCVFIGLTVPVIYVGRNFENILDGIIGLAYDYLPYFNSYYHTNLYMGYPTDNENIVIAFTGIVMVVWLFLWILSYSQKKRVLLGVFPIVALGLELFVGLSPHKNGLLIAFFAIILLMTIGSTSIVKRIVAVVAVGISLILANVLFADNMEELATREKKQAVLAWQENFKPGNINFTNLFQLDLHFNWEQLSNNTPDYTGKILFEIETDKKPNSTLYLKGFYGTNYEDANWTYDESWLQKTCQETGKVQEDVAKQIFQMPYERLAQYHGEPTVEEALIKYKISYTGSSGNVAYVPYVCNYYSMDEQCSFMGDYLLKKPLLDKTIEIRGFNGFTDLYSWKMVNLYIEKGFGNTNLWTEGEIDLNEQIEELEWINGLSDAYLQVPDSAEFISKIMPEIESEAETYHLDIIDRKMIVQMHTENYRRMMYAEIIKSYLNSHMSYSLQLDDLPEGTDPVEYALTEGHEGYCMHFATAATLLLREAGVPARYVSGYAVEPNAFQTDEETGMIKADVGDFMAHAWVEIYLDNIGWIRVEVTPGSSLESLPTQEDLTRWEDTAESFKQGLKEMDSEQETESELESKVTETEEETENTQWQSTEETSEQSMPPQFETPDKAENTEGKQTSNFDWRWLAILGAVLAAIILVIGLIRYLFLRYEMILMKEVKSNKTRKAVKRINRRMWNKLRLMTALERKKNWTDVEYRDALVKHFPEVSEADWDTYMEIVKKNHYSYDEISTQEMEFCYNCYKKILALKLSSVLE